MNLKIVDYWDKWSDEEKEAVIEFTDFAMTVSRESARTVLKELKSVLDGSYKTEPTDSE